MAARTNKITHDDKTREKIQTSQLLNRLQDHVFGKVELSPTQVRSAEICLKKTLPDLVSSENKTEVIHNFVARLPAKASSVEEWQKTFPSSGNPSPVPKPH